MTTSGASVNRSNTVNELLLEDDLPFLERSAQASAEAILGALKPWLDEIEAEAEVESLSIVTVGGEHAVLVKLLWRHQGDRVALLGSALIEGDVAAVGAQATLDALNRKVSGMGSDLVLES